MGRRGKGTELLQTRQKGERMREKWLIGIGSQSASKQWSLERAEVEVRKAAEEAVFAGTLKRNSFETIVAEGRLFAHHDVRDHVPRLVELRDKCWSDDLQLMREVLHGPSQALTDLARCQRDPDKRRHASSYQAYVRYLRGRSSSRGRVTMSP